METDSGWNYRGNNYAPGLTGTASVLGEDRVFGMWQQRVDGVMFFVLATPVKNTVSQHWTQVSNFVVARHVD